MPSDFFKLIYICWIFLVFEPLTESVIVSYWHESLCKKNPKARILSDLKLGYVVI